MKKSKKSTKKSVPSPAPSAWTAKFANPAEIFDHIEDESSGLPEVDLYRARVDELTDLYMRDWRAESEQVARALLATDGGLTLDSTARKVGFLLGFEFAVTLLGKAGAR